MKTAEIKTLARQFGADLIGVADILRFTAVSPEENPAQIFPECKSVIVLGRRILRGAIRGVEEGTNFDSTYTMFGFRWLEDNFLSKTTYDLTCAIESAGFEAVPLFGYTRDGMPTGQAVAPGKPVPNVIVNIDFAAQAAGLGEVGLGGFFITPEYGTRQRFAVILTDAELEPDPISRKSVCGDCGVCAQVCPFGAIDLGHTVTTGVPGHTMEVATIDYAKCRSCPNGAMMASGHGSRPDRNAAVCARACIVQLETHDKLKQRFANPFRKREPWALDIFKRPIPPSSGAGRFGCDDITGTKYQQ